MPPVQRQRGWAFVIVLIALAIAAFLARDSLSGFFGTVTGATRGSSIERAPALPGAAPGAATPGSPVERARAVEFTVQQQADELRRRLDEPPR